MIEIVVEGIVHVVKWLVGQILFEFVLYWIGRITLLILTLGKYPRESQANRAEEICMVVGIIVVLVCIYAFAII